MTSKFSNVVYTSKSKKNYLAMAAGSRLSLLLAACHCADAVKVYFDSITSSSHLISLQEFGSDGKGGKMWYDLHVGPASCSWDTPTEEGDGGDETTVCAWSSLDHVFAVLLTESQWCARHRRRGPLHASAACPTLLTAGPPFDAAGST